MQPYFRSAAVGVIIAGTVFASVITTPPPPALAATSQANPVGVGALEANSSVDPIGIPLKAPSLSWQLTSSSRGTVQSAYQVRVATSERRSCRAPTSGTAAGSHSASSVEVPYAGPDLEGATALRMAGPRVGRRRAGIRLERPGELRDGPRIGRRMVGRELDRRATPRSRHRGPTTR